LPPGKLPITVRIDFASQVDRFRREPRLAYDPEATTRSLALRSIALPCTALGEGLGEGRPESQSAKHVQVRGRGPGVTTFSDQPSSARHPGQPR